MKEKVVKFILATLVLGTVTSTVTALTTAAVNPVFTAVHVGVLIAAGAGVLFMLPRQKEEEN